LKNPGSKKEKSNKRKYVIRKDKYGFPVAICQLGIDVIHLNPSERTGDNIEMIIKELNL